MAGTTSQADAEALAEIKLPVGWTAWRGQHTGEWWAAPPAWMHRPLISAATLDDLAEAIERAGQAAP